MEMLTVKGGGERWGIGAGDRLLEVNGHRVGDIIDWIFYSDSTRNTLKIKDKFGKIRKIEVNDTTGIKLQFESITYRSCPNHCLFCFVDQLPPGLRKSLYFKDEDYRLSFLFGNYITLTNLSEGDLKRIIAQRLSPLYISVHTTDDSLRRRMLGNPKAPPLLPLLRRRSGDKRWSPFKEIRLGPISPLSKAKIGGYCPCRINQMERGPLSPPLIRKRGLSPSH